MARARACDDDVPVCGVVVDDEVTIGGIGVHAYGRFVVNGNDIQVFCGDVLYLFDLFGADLLYQLIGLYGAPIVVPGDLYTCAQVRETIEHPVLCVFPDVDRHIPGMKAGWGLCAAVGEPVKCLSCDGEWQGEAGQELVGPCSDGEDQLFHSIFSGSGDDLYFVCRWVDMQDRFIVADGGSGCGCGRQQGADTFFGEEDAGFLFQETHSIGEGTKGGEASVQGCGIQVFIGDIMGFGAEQGAFYNGCIGPAYHETSCSFEKGLAGQLFYFRPKLIGCHQ